MTDRYLGALPPRYKFTLNPYREQYLPRCPLCEAKLGQKKVPLLIHVDPQHLIALNYTCRFCKNCELLIGHKLTIEHLLFEMFRLNRPEHIGNRYFIIGTVEKAAWRKGLTEDVQISDTRACTSDFAVHLDDISYTSPGYYREGQEPPIMKPPVSDEWV